MRVRRSPPLAGPVEGELERDPRRFGERRAQLCLVAEAALEPAALGVELDVRVAERPRVEHLGEVPAQAESERQRVARPDELLVAFHRGAAGAERLDQLVLE